MVRRFAASPPIFGGAGPAKARSVLVAAACCVLSFHCGGGDTFGHGGAQQEDTDDELLFPSQGEETISLGTTEQITLGAGLSRVIPIQVSPHGVYTVRLVVIAELGDAYVTDSVLVTDENGKAETTLRVLRPDLSIALRASVGPTLYDELYVFSGPSSVASVEITPTYQRSRDVEQWVVSAYPDRSCSEVQGYPLEDGPILGRVDATTNASVELRQVPAAKPVAVLVRAGQFASGCSNVGPLSPGTRYGFRIGVDDRPMQVQGSAMRVALGLDYLGDFKAVLERLSFRGTEALLGGAPNDLIAVFDAMRELLPSPNEYDAALAADNWQATALTPERSPTAGTVLRTLAQAWLDQAGAELEAPDALLAELSAVSDVGISTPTLLSVGRLSSEPLGFRPVGVASVVAESDDFVRIGLSLEFQPAVYLPNVARRISLEAFPGVTSPGGAFAQAFDCDGLARDIVAASTQPGGAAFGTCGEQCMAQLCRDAMDRLWSRVAAAPLPTLFTDFLLAGQASIDLEARPEALSGNLSGSMNVAPLSELTFESAALTGPFGAERQSEGLPSGAE